MFLWDRYIFKYVHNYMNQESFVRKCINNHAYISTDIEDFA